MRQSCTTTNWELMTRKIIFLLSFLLLSRINFRCISRILLNTVTSTNNNNESMINFKFGFWLLASEQEYDFLNFNKLKEKIHAYSIHRNPINLAS
ncbi:hypothetical protein RchiOBHm_Chr7g0221851 [Rosa chinensis]|uniref:Uncharacterized protein n=1 Tax=Rosa chinensis TaxID=74649 RepID=A0A2P6PD48_ROSCH|nr:hypothetical protein RchiOBHm_Chr7g0221851 [Rosa chinensis]